jgi:type IX secretion system PorP/SprF family membrane protein
MIKKNILYLFVLIYFNVDFKAQQQTQYSQYMYSMFSINPAYAGNKNNTQLLLTERKQWTGIEGAPHSQSLIFHAPIKNQKMGYGLNVFNETIGAHGNFGVFGSYSYGITSPEGAIRFGVRAGLYSLKVNSNNITYREGNDPGRITNIQSNIIPSFDAGIHFYKKNMVGGIVLSNLTESKIKFESDNIIRTNLERHFFAYAGYLFSLTDKWMFQPSTMIKYITNSPINIDFNTNFIYNDKIGVGASYRTSRSIVIMTQFFIAKNFRVGYAFDYTFKLTNNANIGGTHEIFVGFDINKKVVGIMNPRYL